MTAVREYVRAHVRLHGRRKTAEHLGVSRHTLWRFLERDHWGRAVPSTVLRTVDGCIQSIEAATLEIIIDLEGLRPDPALRPLRQVLEEALLLLCATPMATLDELSRFGRIPASTVRGRLKKLTERGLVDSAPHHLSVLGSRPQRRYFPTQEGVVALGVATKGRAHALRRYPISRQWFRLLAERQDAVAILYRVAAQVADADPHQNPVRVHHYRSGPYDLLLTLSGGRSIGVLRQGPMLSSANLRYRLRTVEQLHDDDRAAVTLVLAYADQATRRAFRAAADRHDTLVATEGEILAGDVEDEVWQQCLDRREHGLPATVAPALSMRDVVRWAGTLADRRADERRKLYGERTLRAVPDPELLNLSRIRADMPDPAAQLGSSSVALTAAEKDALDLLAAWPLCTRDQLAGLMGGVTRRRVNQTLQVLTRHGLAQADEGRLALTDAGLVFLARRDRAAVGQVLDRWSAALSRSAPNVHAGTELRAITSQIRHHDGVVDFAAALSAEVARSPGLDLLDLLPTHRSIIAFTAGESRRRLHPDASFVLSRPDGWRSYLLEFERRATTPKRADERLAIYRSYYASGWAARDHGGVRPWALFVFETPSSERAFIQAVGALKGMPLLTSNAETLVEHGVLGDAWRSPLTRQPNRLSMLALERSAP